MKNNQKSQLTHLSPTKYSIFSLLFSCNLINCQILSEIKLIDLYNDRLDKSNIRCMLLFQKMEEMNMRYAKRSLFDFK